MPHTATAARDLPPLKGKLGEPSSDPEKRRPVFSSCCNARCGDVCEDGEETVFERFCPDCGRRVRVTLDFRTRKLEAFEKLNSAFAAMVSAFNAI